MLACSSVAFQSSLYHIHAHKSCATTSLVATMGEVCRWAACTWAQPWHNLIELLREYRAMGSECMSSGLLWRVTLPMVCSCCLKLLQLKQQVPYQQYGSVISPWYFTMWPNTQNLIKKLNKPALTFNVSLQNFGGKFTTIIHIIKREKKTPDFLS